MAADSLAVALMALDDEHIREHIRNGDFSVLHPDVVLSAREEELLKAAAAEEIDPEVAGFDAASSAFFQAARMVPGNVLSAPVAESFQSYMAAKFRGLGSAMDMNCACPPMNGMPFGGVGLQM